MWRIVFTKRARKDPLSLEKQVSKRILSKLEKAAENPKKQFSELVGSDYSKLRIGDYRAIVFLEFEEELIEVRRIGHRKNIYKNL